MITAQELKGVMAMMPAFTTPDGGSPGAKDTVNTTGSGTASAWSSTAMNLMKRPISVIVAAIC